MIVGVLGGGQLGLMLAQAGARLGITFRFLDPSAEAPARRAGELVVGAYDDPDALARFSVGLQVITYEFENVPAATARWLADRPGLRVLPPPGALAAMQDRLEEKRLFAAVGLATADYALVGSPSDLRQAAARLGLPLVVKTRRMGYDGKGQFIVRSESQVEAAWSALGARGEQAEPPLIAEKFIEFRRELSLIAARSSDGSAVYYPLVENEHRDGMLRTTHAPAADVPEAMQRAAERYARDIMAQLDYVGVMAIEFFEAPAGPGSAGAGALYGNEMAPRVHNTGHWTIDGAATSQFENHVRAITGMPLGSTAPSGFSTMVNLVGRVPDAARLDELPGVHLHLYGKAGRPGRKIGHATCVADTRDKADALAKRVRELVGPESL